MLVWVDIETTGLDPRRDVILEVSLAATDAGLFRVFSQIDVQLHFDRKGWEARNGALGEYVANMHTKNKLLLECEHKGVSNALAEASIIAWMEDVGMPVGEVPMCGSSVHFDREFLKKYMPAVEKRFHYRNLDVSSIKNAAKLWAPEIANGAPEKQRGTHRGHDDLLDTIDEARYYQLQIFRRAEARTASGVY